MKLNEALEDEIDFWQNLIDCQSYDTPSEVIERMTHARMLAELKLSLLNGDRPGQATQMCES